MSAGGYRLGIDFGTSNTVAMLAWPDGRAKPLLFDGSPLLPSSVFADSAAGLLVGRDAVHAARAFPERFEPHPKRRVDDGLVLLGDDEVAVHDLIAAVLGRVVTEAGRVAGTDPVEVVLTHPASWGPRRRGVLVTAAQAAGLVGVGLAVEPVAAAAYFREVVGSRLPTGTCGLVFDLGGGTFDATVIRADSDGFTVLGTRGLDDAGGLDIDGAIVAHLGATYSARDPQTWQRLAEPQTAADRRASRLLWDDVRAGKETLSRLASTVLHLPLLDEDAPLGREQLDQLARPTLDRSLAAVQAVLRDAEVAPDELTGIFLVGGGSRLPLVSTLLHHALKTAPTVIEQPELVVAEGSLHIAANFSQPAATVAIPAATLEPAAQSAETIKPDNMVQASKPQYRGPTEPSAGTAVERAEPTLVAPPDLEILTPEDATEPSTAETVPSDTGQPLAVADTPVVAERTATEPGAVSRASTLRTGPGRRAAAPAPTRPSDPSRHRIAVLGGLLVLVLAAGVGAVSWYNNHPDSPTSTGGAPGNNGAPSNNGSPTSSSTVTASSSAAATSGNTRRYVELSQGTGMDTVYAVAFTKDGNTLATGSNVWEGTARLWNVATGKQIGDPLTNEKHFTHGVAFNPDGTILATADEQGTARLWDVATGKEIGAPLTGFTDEVTNVAFSPDGKILAAASGDKSVRLWDVATRRELGVLSGHTNWVNSVAFSPDGHTLATASTDNTVRLWDVATRKHIGTITGHTDVVTSVAFNPKDNNVLATASGDKTVRLWNVQSHEPIGAPITHSMYVNSVAFSPDGKTLATGADDMTARLFNVQSHEPIGAPLTGHRDQVTEVAFSPTEPVLATASKDGTVRLWDISAG